MFEIGGSLQELLLIFVVALLVVGPKRLPEVGQMIGRAMREWRRAHEELRSTVERHLDPAGPPVRSAPAETPPEAKTSPSPAGTESPMVPTVEPARSQEVDGEASPPYVGRHGGRLFHRRECRWVPRLEDRVPFGSVTDAERAGLTACPACQ